MFPKRCSYLLARLALFPLFSWFPFWSLEEGEKKKKKVVRMGK